MKATKCCHWLNAQSFSTASQCIFESPTTKPNQLFPICFQSLCRANRLQAVAWGVNIHISPNYLWEKENDDTGAGICGTEAENVLFIEVIETSTDNLAETIDQTRYKLSYIKPVWFCFRLNFFFMLVLCKYWMLLDIVLTCSRETHLKNISTSCRSLHYCYTTIIPDQTKRLHPLCDSFFELLEFLCFTFLFLLSLSSSPVLSSHQTPADLM